MNSCSKAYDTNKVIKEHLDKRVADYEEREEKELVLTPYEVDHFIYAKSQAEARADTPSKIKCPSPTAPSLL